MPRWFWPAAAAALWHALLLALYLGAFRGDPGALVCVNGNAAGQPPYEAVQRGFVPRGYDGQFYYAIARSPWRPQHRGMDVAPARHLRILYPVLAWLLSGGDRTLLLWTLPLVNLAAIATLAGLGAHLALARGLSPWWGFALPLAVNAGMPALRDLTDPLATLAVAGLLIAWLTEAPSWTLVLWAAAAVFSREQNVVVVLLVLAAAATKRRCGLTVSLAGVVGAWAGWFVLLRGVYGEWPLLPSQGNVSVPFSGMFFRWTHLGLSGSASSALLHAARMLHLLLQMALAGYLATQSTDRVVKATMLAGVALAVLAGTFVYEDAWSYTRVFVWLPLGIWLASMEVRRHWPAALLLPAACWPLVAVARAWLEQA